MNEPANITVREAMDTDVVIIDGMATVSEAIEVMVSKKTSTLIIDKRHDQDEYGILLAADIANHVLAQNKAPERINAYEIMSKPILFVRPDMDIRYCSRFFKRFGISQAPVIDHSTIIGIVSYDSMIIKGMTR